MYPKLWPTVPFINRRKKRDTTGKKKKESEKDWKESWERLWPENGNYSVAGSGILIVRAWFRPYNKVVCMFELHYH